MRITLLGHTPLNGVVRKNKIMLVTHLHKVQRKHRRRAQYILKSEKWSNSDSLTGLD